MEGQEISISEALARLATRLQRPKELLELSPFPQLRARERLSPFRRGGFAGFHLRASAESKVYRGEYRRAHNLFSDMKENAEQEENPALERI